MFLSFSFPSATPAGPLKPCKFPMSASLQLHRTRRQHKDTKCFCNTSHWSCCQPNRRALWIFGRGLAEIQRDPQDLRMSFCTNFNLSTTCRQSCWINVNRQIRFALQQSHSDEVGGAILVMSGWRWCENREAIERRAMTAGRRPDVSFALLFISVWSSLLKNCITNCRCMLPLCHRGVNNGWNWRRCWCKTVFCFSKALSSEA